MGLLFKGKLTIKIRGLRPRVFQSLGNKAHAYFHALRSV